MLDSGWKKGIVPRTLVSLRNPLPMLCVLCGVCAPMMRTHDAHLGAQVRMLDSVPDSPSQSTLEDRWQRVCRGRHSRVFHKLR